MTKAPSFDAACAEVPALLEQGEFRFRPGEVEAYERFGRGHQLRFVVTGIGGSESPARSIGAALRAGGLWAEYHPLSAFLEGNRELHRAQPVEPGRCLIVVSQGLSPNAQLALGERANYAITVLVTSRPGKGSELEQRLASLASDGVIVVPTQVPSEPRALVRMAGPACLAAAGELVVRELSSVLFGQRGLAPEQGVASQSFSLGRAYASAFERALPLAMSCARGRSLAAVVVTEPLGELIQADLWKWREALGEEPPPVFDGFSFVHGPLQTLTETDGPVLIVSRATAAAHALSARLQHCLRGIRHATLEFELTAAREHAWFEINALFSRWVLVLARERERNLGEWRGTATDAPVYSLHSRQALESS